MPVTLPVIDSDGMGDASREGDADREGERILVNPILGIHATAHQLGVSESDAEADANMMFMESDGWEEVGMSDPEFGMSDEAERILREQAMLEEEEEEEMQENEEMQEDDEEENSIWEDESSEDGDFDIKKEFEEQFGRLPTKINMEIWPEDELDRFKEDSWVWFKEDSPSAAKFIFDLQQHWRNMQIHLEIVWLLLMCVVTSCLGRERFPYCTVFGNYDKT